MSRYDLSRSKPRTRAVSKVSRKLVAVIVGHALVALLAIYFVGLAGHGEQQFGEEPVGDVVGFGVEVGEASFEQSVGAADGVGAAKRGLETHDPSVQLFCLCRGRG
jgi:hypothetical protein